MDWWIDGLLDRCRSVGPRPSQQQPGQHPKTSTNNELFRTKRRPGWSTAHTGPPVNGGGVLSRPPDGQHDMHVNIIDSAGNSATRERDMDEERENSRLRERERERTVSGKKTNPVPAALVCERTTHHAHHAHIHSNAPSAHGPGPGTTCIPVCGARWRRESRRR